MAGEKATFTVRAVVIGSVMTAFYAWLCPVSVYSIFSGRFEQGILPPGIIALNMVLLALNLLVHRLNPRISLSTGELVIVFAMTWIGAAVFQIGLIGNTLGIMAGPEYFTSPENRWDEYYLAYLPTWMCPSNHAGGVRALFNGLPPDESIPWGIWRVPFIWWGSLIAAILVVVISLMTIVQEQWHDREKLTFPMADIPLALIERAEGSHWLPSWMQSRLFWYGAITPLFFIVWNSMGWFHEAFPHIGFSQDETGLILRYWPNFYTKVDFFTIGMAYFAPVQVLLGLWLGRMLIGAEMAFGVKFGFGNGMNTGFEPWSDWGTNTAAWQCLGSLVMFVIWGLWMARDHLGLVARSAFWRTVDLPEHLRSRYRMAVWGLLGGLCYMAAWFHHAGMSAGVIALFLSMFCFLTLGISKVILESSVIMCESPVSPQTFVLQTVGVSHISQLCMTAMVMSYAVIRSNHGMMLAQASFTSRMGDEHGIERGKLYAALGIAVIVAIIVAVVTTFILAHEVGAFNFQSHAFTVGHVEAYASLAEKSNAQDGPDFMRMGFFGGGMVLMWTLLMIRTRMPGFWLHPVGLTFTSTSVFGLMTINFFIAWLLKATFTRVGGMRMVNRAKPFFLGLICGHAMGVAYGVIIDAIFFYGQGHRILTGW